MFGKKTYTTITASLATMVMDLRTLIDEKDADIADMVQKEADLVIMKALANTEKDLATKTANKLGDLINWEV